MGIILNNEDCIDTLKKINDASIDLILQDPPYGVTQNKWDIAPDLDLMWGEWLRVIKNNGAIIFTAQQPFVTDLINSQRNYFRYDLIWEKIGKATGFLNANRMPLRNHEHILVFYKNLPTYNPQKVKGNKNHRKGNNSRGKKQTNNNYGDFDQSFESEPTDDKFPLSVLSFKSVHPPEHPTQKPIDLMRWLIRTFTNEGSTVFDGYSGVGTTAVACLMENRNFIGAEISQDYHKLAIKRITEQQAQPTLPLII
jgi:site-specific DNA-methyltransferase (adenine-specific)